MQNLSHMLKNLIISKKWEAKIYDRHGFLATAKHTYASFWREHVGAISNMVRTTTEAASPGGEG